MTKIIRNTPWPDLTWENSYQGIVTGLDEAGRGPWAGPVVAAAVIINQKNIKMLAGIHDSKKLSSKKRQFFFHQIQAYAQTAIGIATVKEIDTLNILHANDLAMYRAFTNLPTTPDIALIDGNRQPPHFPCLCKTIVKGDSQSLSIAAASIIAKVTRDTIMKKLSEKYNHYHWHKNFGYGTKQHLDGMTKHGITPHHRKSFAPVKQFHPPNE